MSSGGCKEYARFPRGSQSVHSQHWQVHPFPLNTNQSGLSTTVKLDFVILLPAGPPQLGPPVVPVYPFSGKKSPTKGSRLQKTGSLILSSLLEDLDVGTASVGTQPNPFPPPPLDRSTARRLQTRGLKSCGLQDQVLQGAGLGTSPPPQRGAASFGLNQGALGTKVRRVAQRPKKHNTTDWSQMIYLFGNHVLDASERDRQRTFPA